MSELAIPPALGPLVDLVFLAATGSDAWHGSRFRAADGEADPVRLLFGAIAALFFIAVLLRDVLGVIDF